MVLFRKKNRKDFLYGHEIEEVCSNTLEIASATDIMSNQLLNISFTRDIELDNINDDGSIINHFDIKKMKYSDKPELEKERMLKILPGLKD